MFCYNVKTLKRCLKKTYSGETITYILPTIECDRQNVEIRSQVCINTETFWKLSYMHALKAHTWVF